MIRDEFLDTLLAPAPPPPVKLPGLPPGPSPGPPDDNPPEFPTVRVTGNSEAVNPPKPAETKTEENHPVHQTQKPLRF